MLATGALSHVVIDNYMYIVIKIYYAYMQLGHYQSTFLYCSGQLIGGCIQVCTQNTTPCNKLINLLQS